MRSPQCKIPATPLVDTQNWSANGLHSNLQYRPLFITGSGERLNNHPTTLVVFNVGANLASEFWVTEAVNIVILYDTHTHMPMYTAQA